MITSVRCGVYSYERCVSHYDVCHSMLMMCVTVCCSPAAVSQPEFSQPDEFQCETGGACIPIKDVCNTIMCVTL